MQYNTVVSAAMKMLNSLDTLKDNTSEGTRAVINEGVSILFRLTFRRPGLRSAFRHFHRRRSLAED